MQWSMLLYCSVKCMRSRVQSYFCTFFSLSLRKSSTFTLSYTTVSHFRDHFYIIFMGIFGQGSQSLRCLKCLSKSGDICQHLVSFTSLCSAFRLDYVFLMWYRWFYDVGSDKGTDGADTTGIRPFSSQEKSMNSDDE